MAKEVVWTKKRYDEFISQACLSDFQAKVMEKHVLKNMTIAGIASELHAGESTVSKAIKECKIAYDAVQQFSDILPVREKKSVK